MKRSPLLCSFSMLAAPLLLTLPSSGALLTSEVTVSTDENRLNPNRMNSGWWSDVIPGSGNSNYFTGYLQSSATPNASRGFFSFYVAGVPDMVASATLRIPLDNSVSPDATETLELFDVSTSILGLHETGVTDLLIYEDLGTGTSYGSLEVAIGSPNTTVLEIPLNQDAIADLNANTGDYFSIGASLATLGSSLSDEYLFGGSGNREVELSMVLVPEPSALLLLVAALPLVARRKRSA